MARDAGGEEDRARRLEGAWLRLARLRERHVQRMAARNRARIGQPGLPLRMKQVRASGLRCMRGVRMRGCRQRCMCSVRMRGCRQGCLRGVRVRGCGQGRGRRIYGRPRAPMHAHAQAISMHACTGMCAGRPACLLASLHTPLHVVNAKACMPHGHPSACWGRLPACTDPDNAFCRCICRPRGPA
eukprot:361363-Chlamydomonas_euryale.AAC.6